MQHTAYRYRPVLFFALAYLFTWIFWIPAIFIQGNTGTLLMMLGLIAPAVVSTLFVVFSGSDALKKDLRQKIAGFYKVKWTNVLLAIVVFAAIIACSILLSLVFGQPLSQFSLTEDFSFTGVGIGSALLTILIASIIEEVGWKGYCEDSIGNYMNWFWESMLFGALWSFWHFPLIFIQGTYQAGNEDGSPKKMGRKPHYPSAWKDSFGLPVEEHANQLKIDVLDNFARYQVVKPKVVQQQFVQEKLDVLGGNGNDGNN